MLPIARSAASVGDGNHLDQFWRQNGVEQLIRKPTDADLAKASTLDRERFRVCRDPFACIINRRAEPSTQFWPDSVIPLHGQPGLFGGKPMKNHDRHGVQPYLAE